MKKSILFLVGIFFLLAVVANAADTPPVNYANAEFTQRNLKSKDFFTLVSFGKTDGLTTNMMGVNVYIMAWRAVIELTRDCYFWKYEGPPQGKLDTGNDIVITNEGPSDPILNRFPLFWKQHKGTKGQKIILDGSTMFARTERGWQIWK